MSIIGPKLYQVFIIATGPTIENIGTRKSELTVIKYLPKKHLSKSSEAAVQLSDVLVLELQ